MCISLILVCLFLLAWKHCADPWIKIWIMNYLYEIKKSVNLIFNLIPN